MGQITRRSDKDGRFRQVEASVPEVMDTTPLAELLTLDLFDPDEVKAWIEALKGHRVLVFHR